jgi:Rhodanese-like domain
MHPSGHVANSWHEEPGALIGHARICGGPRWETAPAYPTDLQQRLGEAKLRLIDTRPKPDYEKGHIPGAVWVDAKAAENLAARAGGLEDKDAWEVEVSA